MRIGNICTTCARQNPEQRPKLYWGEVQDDGANHVECDKGHVTVYVMQQQKFEILYEFALHAIVDGYYREAVSSFASSLERFYEFALRVFMINRKVEFDRYVEAWGMVSKQSERQLGAYVFSYLADQGTKPPLLPEKWIAFRNEVIHKGKIPEKAKAIEFGQAVLGTIFDPLKLICSNYQQACEQAIIESITDIKAKYEKRGIIVIGHSYPMTLRNIDSTVQSPPDINKCLEAVGTYMRPHGDKA